MISQKELRRIKGALTLIAGFAIGIVNAIFGAGGGMVAVPFFKKQGKNQKQAQASAVAVILPLCVISAAIYYYKGYYSLSEAFKYLPFSVLGGIVGAFALKKIPDKMLKKVFSLLMIYLGIKMLF